jgi:hypothetical protein
MVNECVANLEIFVFFMLRECSFYLICNEAPVFLKYIYLQSRHVNLYISGVSYFAVIAVYYFLVFVFNDIFIFLFSDSFVTVRILLTVYLNVVHFFVLIICL